MSMLSREKRILWVHDVCRVWCDVSTEIPSLEHGGKGRMTKESLGTVGVADAVCALCGVSNNGGLDEYNGIIKCAASGCSIFFHPMCALYLSKCDEIGEKSCPGEAEGDEDRDQASNEYKAGENQDQMLQQLLLHDQKLCRQYSLRFAKCKIPGIRRVGKASIQSSPSSAIVLPVCFCGIHNPKRDRSLYGLYPGGQLIDGQVLRLPPRMKCDD